MPRKIKVVNIEPELSAINEEPPNNNIIDLSKPDEKPEPKRKLNH